MSEDRAGSRLECGYRLGSYVFKWDWCSLTMIVSELPWGVKSADASLRGSEY